MGRSIACGKVKKEQISSNDQETCAMWTMGRARMATEIVHMASASAQLVSSAPDPEIPKKNSRCKFTSNYKLRILAEAGANTLPGQLGALLRREGLYSSNRTTWCQKREKSILQVMTPKKCSR